MLCKMLWPRSYVNNACLLACPSLFVCRDCMYASESCFFVVGERAAAIKALCLAFCLLFLH
jgi:hypothetical protein